MQDTPLCHIDSITAGTREDGPAERLIQLDPALDAAAGADELCQVESTPTIGSLRRPGILYGPARALWNLRHRGLRYTIQTVFMPRAVAAATRLGLIDPPRTTQSHPHEVLNLKSGDLVEVKSAEEILQTLDGKNRHRGLVFTPEMRKHCGRRYRVFKRLEFMFDEYRHTQRRLRNTVLLENVHCTGEGIGCDRACFLYWREVWLRRVGEASDASNREKSYEPSHTPMTQTPS